MALTNLNKKQVDLPNWQGLMFLPVTSAAGLTLCTADDGSTEYIYYYGGATSFYRYSTIADGWQLLSSPQIAPVTSTALKYSMYGGYRSIVLSSTGNTVNIAGLKGDLLKGYKIRIYEGLGIGQEKTITSISDSIILDQGVVTVASNSGLTDNTKKWKINQWVGYQVRLTYGSGASQIRKVLYNDTFNLYFYDPNYQQLETWNNNTFSATAPYAIPSATLGVQTHFTIEYSVATLDTPWDILPDTTSSFVVLSGGIFLLSSQATTPWSSMQYYDIISDTWTYKTALGGNLLAALGTDFQIDRTGEIGGLFLSGGTSSASTFKTLVVSGDTTLLTERWTNYQIRIVSGTGIGQRRRIVANNINSFTIEEKWDTIPDTSSVYNILGDVNKIYLAGNAGSSLYQYSIEEDIWSESSTYDYGIVRSSSCQFYGQEAFGVTSIIRNTGATLSVNPTPTFGGSNYTYGDILTMSTGGTLGKVRVTSVNTNGSVLSIELFGCGLNYTVGPGKATSGGLGTGCTIEITSVGPAGRVSPTMNHNLAIGDQIILSGFTEAAWNSGYTVLGTDSVAAFDIATTATLTAVTNTILTVNNIVDTTKSWVPNEHVGKLVTIQGPGLAPATTQIRRISGNTYNTLTFATITIAVNGISRYFIHDIAAFGKDTQWKNGTLGNTGYTYSGTTTTLTDNTKTWYMNQWLGYKFRIISGTGMGNEIAISANTSNTLQFLAQAYTVDTTTKYIIMDSYGLVTGNVAATTLGDTTKNWLSNQWIGKKVRFTSGTGTGQELLISSNTATVLTFGAGTATPDTTTTYTILGEAPRGAGLSLIWIFGNSNALTRGKYLISFRGANTTQIDKYDITTEMWDYTYYIQPQSEFQFTGSMYTYDSKDRIYFTPQSTNRVQYLDVNTGKVNHAGQTPYAHGTAIIGNRMEIIKTIDGLTYLYIARHTGQEFWRALAIDMFS